MTTIKLKSGREWEVSRDEFVTPSGAIEFLRFRGPYEATICFAREGGDWYVNDAKNVTLKDLPELIAHAKTILGKAKE